MPNSRGEPTAGGFPGTRYGHDFSHARVHAGSFGEDGAPADQTFDQDPSLNTPIGPAGPVQLAYATQSKADGWCGNFEWVIKWELKNVTPHTNGFIVQKVRSDLFAQPCLGGAEEYTDDFNFWWEAWRVKDGQILTSGPFPGDRFAVSNAFGEKGSVVMSGTAKYMDAYTEPLKWGRVKEAGSMPATVQEPPGWSESGAKYRSIAKEYECCGDVKRHSPLTIEEFDIP